MTSRRHQKKAERRRLAMLFSEVTRSIGYVRSVDLVSRESPRGLRKRKSYAKVDGVPWWSLQPHRDRGICLCWCLEPVWRVSFSGKRTSSRRREYWTALVTLRTCRTVSDAVRAHTESISEVVSTMRRVRARRCDAKSSATEMPDDEEST